MLTLCLQWSHPAAFGGKIIMYQEPGSLPSQVGDAEYLSHLVHLRLPQVKRESQERHPGAGCLLPEGYSHSTEVRSWAHSQGVLPFAV